MKVPKSIDFSNIKEKKIIENGTSAYNILLSLNDDNEWKEYNNEMLSRGVSVIYDASGDFFLAKPVSFKENKMSKNKNQLSENQKLTNEVVRYVYREIKGSPNWVKDAKRTLKDLELNENDSSHILQIINETYFSPKSSLNEEKYPWKQCISDQKKRYGSKETAKKVCGKIKSMSESEELEEDDEEKFQNFYKSNLKEADESKDDKQLLLDDEDEENEMDIEISAVDLDNDDEIEFEGDIDTINNGGDFEQQDLNYDVNDVDHDDKNLLLNSPDQSLSSFSLQDLEALVKQIVTGSQQANQNILDDTLAERQDIVNNSASDPHIDILNSEFSENRGNVDRIENRIENDESYLEVLNGGDEDIISASEEEFGEFDMEHQPGGNFEIFEEPPVEVEKEIIEEDEELQDLDVLDSQNEEELEFDIPEDNTIENGIFNYQGKPVKIQITGWLITIPEVTQLAEAVKKTGNKLKGLVSSNKKELNLFVENKGKKIYKIKYIDKPKSQNLQPWSINDKKFISLNEALNRINTTNKKINKVSDRKRFFKSLVTENKDICTRQMTKLNDANIFEDFRSKKNSINYVPSWNIKSVGSLDLKKGLNETYSRITEHNSKGKNTLFKTKEGKYYLIKGSLNEMSSKGTKRHLVDLEGKRDYGVGEVVGLYENTLKGLGEIMYKIKRTSIPLLVWKTRS